MLPSQVSCDRPHLQIHSLPDNKFTDLDTGVESGTYYTMMHIQMCR